MVATPLVGSGTERAHEVGVMWRADRRLSRVPAERSRVYGSVAPAGVESSDPPASISAVEVSRTIIVLDAADLDEVSSFWARLLGGTVDPEDDWHTVRVDGEARLGIQLAPDHVAPRWPTEPGHPQQQIHLDLFVTDPPAAHEHALAVGARLVQPADLSAAAGFEVYTDPAGHPFCLCWG